MIRLTTSALLNTMFAVATIALPLGAHAEWTGDIEGGTVIDGDNKGTTIGFTLSNIDRPFSQEIYADWLRGDDKNNNFEFGYTPRYWFSDTTYAYGEGAIRTFGSVSLDDYERKLGGGLGIELINTETQQLFAEVGANQITAIMAATDLLPELNESVVATVASLGGSQILSDLIKLEFDLDYSTSDDLVQTGAEGGLSLRIPSGAIKYTYRYRSNTVGDEEAVSNTDSAISFNYAF